MTLICEGSKSKNDVLIQTIDEYREVFVRTRQSFAVLAERVNHYLNSVVVEEPEAQGPRGAREMGGGGGGGGGGGNGRGGGGGGNGRGGGGGGNGRGGGNGSGGSGDSDDNFDHGNGRPPRGRGNSRARGQGSRPIKSKASERSKAIVDLVSRGNDDKKKPKCQCGGEVRERTVIKEGPNNFTPARNHKMTVLAAFKAGLMKQPETLTYKAPAQLPIIRILRNLGGSTNPEVKPRCECDLEASRKVTVKEGPNKGRAFLVCSRISKAAQCKYFKWEDELEGTVTAPVAGPSKYSSNGNENSYSKNFQARSTDTQMSNYTCYVCNQAGHFANNCPNRTEGSNKPQGSSSECYLCGKSACRMIVCSGHPGSYPGIVPGGPL
ncbi:expressed protein [Phakopsora pachyrhizi]|uniref:Expressed protein n=1 Tax=Phakopsora pachyrhizi TaxID=170000 RepID=A0AAV0APK8_PHAPC|nr:expressed protein [Phakopsora pachyrhizi]